MDTVSLTNISTGNRIVVIKRWEGLAKSKEIGASADMTGLTDISFQVDGDFDELTKIVIMGSNDKKNYFPLSDKQGNKLVIRNKGIYSIGDNVAALYPELVGSDTTTKANVTLHARSIV